MSIATVFDIQRNSFVDGPGIRTTVFFKGCNLACAWCHNPESQSSKPQMMFYQNKCIGCGKCKEVCPHALERCDLCGKCTLYCPGDAREICGREETAESLFTEIQKDKSFYENSGGGVTFSGGECMLQIDFLTEILKKCRENGIHTAVDTAGHVPFAWFERIIPYTDLFLYDIKCMESEKHRRSVGVSNELILDNLKALLAGGAAVWIRIPVIVGVNDSMEQMQSINSFFLRYGRPQKVELLPYHATGEHKYAALGKEPPRFVSPSKEKMEALRAVFRDNP